MRGIVLVSIEFEHFESIEQDASKNVHSQVGIAVIYTRDIGSLPPENAIKLPFCHWLTCIKANTAFMLGKTVGIRQQDMRTSIEAGMS